jgi:pimeloyl-ACP methyl ester carboxylesterase
MSEPVMPVVPVPGPRVVFVHGSAADHTTWSINLRSPLRDRFELVAYDRRVAPDETVLVSVEDHADDLAAVIEGRGPTGVPAARGPVLAIGSSFGGAVVLELARRRPELLRGMVLCEPPLTASDAVPSVPLEFRRRFAELLVTDGGEAAAEYFLRSVLGDAPYERMPRVYQDRAKGQWRQIDSDSRSLAAYRVRYGELGAITVPTLLLGGGRSAPFYRPTLEALAASLGRARLEILPNAGHMLHAEAHRAFHDHLTAFASSIGHA